MTNSEKHVDVLILDDDLDLLTTTAELLADMGYKVKGFADPESALEFAIGQTFSVGLFDFIRKPVAPEVLLETIGRALVQSQKLAA
jgi:FixJ family two-component response regulator